MAAEDEDEKNDDEPAFTWEEQLEGLIPDLLRHWQRFAEGNEKLETRRLLEEAPRFKDLPLKPAENNLMSSRLDRELRAAQKMFLHSLRLQAALYKTIWGSGGQSSGTAQTRGAGDAPEAKAKGQQLWAYACSCYGKLQATRREAAAPGFTPKEGSQLFGAEELREVKQKRKLGQLRRP